MLERKCFQTIDWSSSKFDSNVIEISSKIFDKYEQLKNEINDKKYVIAIGLNPSNKTSFNDDLTNLYLRDKIHSFYSDAKGYILVNLIPKVESDSSNISLKNVDEDYIKDWINLLKNYDPVGIVLFFGQRGVKLINQINKKIPELKKILMEKINIIRYTSRAEEFVHPSRFGDNYELVKWKDGLLEG